MPTIAGIYLDEMVGPVESTTWADPVMDLVLHPRCPPLDDQLLIWAASAGQWESHHPFARRPRRPVRL